jgi:hypothetical protein
MDEPKEHTWGETDPKVIKAARALAKLRGVRARALGIPDSGNSITRQDIEDARAVFDTLGMSRC